jgi:predicted phosphodiesterase
MTRYLVMTDMHFGTQESAVNRAEIRAALVDHVVRRSPWERIVLAGDIFDANLSTLKRSIEGNEAGTLCGFRRFLGELHASASQLGKGGLPSLARRWVYVPGNHDYKIWDILASKVAFEDPIAAGEVFGGKVKLPVERHSWIDGEAFVSGLWKGDGFDASDQVQVEYPDHRLAFGEDDLVITHGHYLDSSQTRFNDLSECLRPGLSAVEASEVVRQIVIEAAQYQAVANAMSYRKDTTGFVDALFGPAGLGNKVRKLFSVIGGWIASLSFGPNGRRGATLSPKLLRNVDAYLEHFPSPLVPARPVKWFVFGHTHAQGEGWTPKGVPVWNTGSCYDDHGKPVTFVEIEVEQGAPRVQLKGISRAEDGNWVVV